MPKALIAVFSPKADAPDDVALDLAFKAAETKAEGRAVEALELPRNWSEAFPILERELSRDWDVVLLVSGADLGSIAVERLALNECDPREKDNEGRRPLSKEITAGGEPGYWTGLPYRELVLGMSSRGVPSYASHNPGGGVPNMVFFKLMEYIARRKSSVISGLIQLPFMESLRFLDKIAPERVLPLLLETVFELSEREDNLSFDINRLADLKGSPTP